MNSTASISTSRRTPFRGRNWRALAAWTALLLPASAVVAQEAAPAGLADVLGTFARLMFLWGCGGWILWLVGMVVSGRLLGLEMTFGRVVGVTFLAPLIVLVPVVLLIIFLGSQLGSAALGFATQAIYFAGEVVAIKLICDTDYPRAILTLLLALTFVLVVMALLMIVML